MAWLYFTIDGPFKMARCLLTALIFILRWSGYGSAKFCHFTEHSDIISQQFSLSQWLCPLLRPYFVIHRCCTYIQIHQIPINSRAAQPGTWRVCSNAKPWRLKIFYLEPEPLLSQPPCSKRYLPWAQKAVVRYPHDIFAWYQVFSILFAFHSQSFFMCLLLLTFQLQISPCHWSEIFVWTKKLQWTGIWEIKSKWQRIFPKKKCFLKCKTRGLSQV